MSAVFQNKKTDWSVGFRDIADKICAIASKYSVEITGYHSARLPLYRALPPQKQSEALQLLNIFLQTMEATEAAGNKIDNQGCFVWSAHSSMGLIPPSDLFLNLKSLMVD